MEQLYFPAIFKLSESGKSARSTITYAVMRPGEAIIY